MPVFLNADEIAAVEVDKQYDGKCVEVVGKIGLNETVEQVREAIESARTVGVIAFLFGPHQTVPVPERGRDTGRR
jgi:hypothetical protein